MDFNPNMMTATGQYTAVKKQKITKAEAEFLSKVEGARKNIETMYSKPKSQERTKRRSN